MSADDRVVEWHAHYGSRVVKCESDRDTIECEYPGCGRTFTRRCNFNEEYS